MSLRRVPAALLLAALLVTTLAALPSSAGAFILPGGDPWTLKVRASGSVDVSWKVSDGLQAGCQDWYRERGSDTMVLLRPSRPATGSYYAGSLSASGRTTGKLLRNLSASGGTSADAGCPGVCAASASSIAAPAPTARAADCITPDTKQIDASGCDPTERTLSTARFTVTARRRNGVVPTSALVSFAGGLKKPFTKCGNPPLNVLFDGGQAQVPLRLLPRLAKGGLVSGAAKRTEKCRGYPKDDGYRKVECKLTWDVKVTILRTE